MKPARILAADTLLVLRKSSSGCDWIVPSPSRALHALNYGEPFLTSLGVADTIEQPSRIQEQATLQLSKICRRRAQQLL
jgi:hypothetical protein